MARSAILNSCWMTRMLHHWRKASSMASRSGWWQMEQCRLWCERSISAWDLGWRCGRGVEGRAVVCLSDEIGRGFLLGRFLGWGWDCGAAASSTGGCGATETIMGSPRFSKDSMAALKAGRLSRRLVGFSIVGWASLVGPTAGSDGAASAAPVTRLVSASWVVLFVLFRSYSA